MGVLALFKKHEISPEEDSQLEDIVFTAAHVIQETAAIEALRESEYKYRRLFENVTDAVMIFEAETQKVVDANKSAVDLYGYTREGLLELKYPYICAQVDDTKISEGGMSKDTGNTGQVGYHRKNDGTIFPVEVSEAVFMLGSSKMICRLVRDITQRLESERLKEQLLQSQKMEAIGTLAGGIAHDFNNILYALIGYAKLAILESDPNCNVHDYLKQIEIAGHRAAELVRQILAFSRQSEGTQRPVKLQAIISETIALLRGTLPATVEIYQRVSDDCPPVETDGVQINQMLMNLCTNAFQAMQDRRGVLEIGLDEVIVTKEQAARVEGLRPGKYARLVVTDNGVGMSESVAKRVFDPYFTTKRPGQGSGLGLSIVHGIIKSHKGAINIVSSPGQGTKCEVYLPIKCSDGNDYEEPENQERGEAWTGTGHILFVDDEKMITDMADNILSDHGYRVSAFTDSTKALAAFRESPMSYDLVISDITMPKTTGIELSQEIRRHRPDIPIILCTGYSDVLDLEWAENFGIEACLEKPIDLVYLKRVIWEALEFRPVKEA
ncbi:MAG: response regulator [Candidatus Eisenbacteria bacterium]|nr:response regulator [Candidatus Eisenbacteria bacterium]